MLQFSQPVMLWGLLALLIPIIIHLFSRSKHKQVLFSTLSLFPNQPPINRKQIKVTQWRLLLLRLLLVTATVLLLAGIHFGNKNRDVSAFHLVTDDWLASANQQQRNALIEKLNASNDGSQTSVYRLGASSRLTETDILEGKPSLAGSATNVWQAVAQWLSENTASHQKITIHTTNRLSQFVGEPVGLPAEINWSVIESEISSASETDIVALSVLLVSGAQVNLSLQQRLDAAFERLNQAATVKITVTNVNADAALSQDLNQVDAVVLLDTLADSRQLQFTKDTTVVDYQQLNALDSADFSIALAELLFQSAIDEHYWRNVKVSREVISSAGQGRLLDVTQATIQSADFPLWWLLLCVFLFVGERWLSEILTKPVRTLTSDD